MQKILSSRTIHVLKTPNLQANKFDLRICKRNVIQVLGEALMCNDHDQDVTASKTAKYTGLFLVEYFYTVLSLCTYLRYTQLFPGSIIVLE